MLRPSPRATVRFRDTDYEVLSLLDIPYSQMMDILGAAQAPRKSGETDIVYNVRRSKDQLCALVPALEADVVSAMTYHEMEAFLDAALGVGGNPPPAAATSSS